MVDFNYWASRAFIYSATILLVTVIVSLKVLRRAERAPTFFSCTLPSPFQIYATGAYLEIGHLRKQSSKLKAQAALSPNMNRAMSPQMDRKVADDLDDEWFAGVRRQATLLDWAARNRTWTAALIVLMLVESAGMMLWYGLAPLSIVANAPRFKAQILVAVSRFLAYLRRRRS